MFVKPTSGRVVRDPVTMVALPPDGAEVDSNDIYWQRRLLHGDVAEASAAVAAASTKGRRVEQ